MPTPFVESPRFPEDISYGARGGPGFKTSILELSGGHEQRNGEWSEIRSRYDVAQAVNTDALLQVLLTFFYARRGRLIGFRYKDFLDFTLERQLIGLTDGSTATFQIYKRYEDAGGMFDRPLRKPVVGTVMCWVNDVAIVQGAGAAQFQVDTTTGIITLGATLAAQSGTDVEAACEFDVPVRFDVDQQQLQISSFAGRDWDSIPLVELRE